ncbi:MAG: hypothetical protein ACRC8Y_05025 [Chroococcales cyanobacterium]
MLALISPFQNLIDSLPTSWVELIDRPSPTKPSTSDAIAFSLLPARMVLAALEKFIEPDVTDHAEPQTLQAKAQPCLPPAKVKRYEAKKRETEQVTVQRVLITPASTPQLQPDDETPNLNDSFRVTGATGWFNVRPHGEGFVVDRQKKTKKRGWEKTTHLIGSHGCDCSQSQKKPSSVCCHQKALKSFQLSEKTRLQKEEWESRDNEKSAKVKAEPDAIATQRTQDKLNALIRDEAQKVEQAKEDLGLAAKLPPKGDRDKLLVECRDLLTTCSFNKNTGPEFLAQRYSSKERLDLLSDDELTDLADHLSTNRVQLKKTNLRDRPVADGNLSEGAIVKGPKTGWPYRIKKIQDDGFAQVETLTGGAATTIPLDKLQLA